MPSRVAVTEEAAKMLRYLVDKHGEVTFHQSGGCCDGSSPMCFPKGEFITGPSDVCLGVISIGNPYSDIEVFMSKSQFEYWKHTHLTIDVVKGRGGGFSLEAPEGVRFIIRSRLLEDDETKALEGLDNQKTNP